MSATTETACVLADHALVQVVLELLQALELAGHELADGDAGARGDHRGDLGLADRARGQVAVELGQARLEPVDLVLDAARVLVGLGVDRGLLLGLHRLDPRAQAGRLGVAAAQLHARGRLVDEVDRLVGQPVLGDVAVRQPRGRLERGIVDLDVVVGLVGRAQPAEDRHGLLDRGLLDHHGGEAARERAVALDRAVFGQRRGADHPQLAAGEHRLEHVGGVHRALGLAGAEHGVQLVDEQDDPALGRDDLGERGLHPLLELAAVLGAGEHAGEVKRHHPRLAQGLGHVAVGDPEGEALGDRGLADAGLADQHGVVLAPAGEDLDRLLDLVRAPDHGVDAAVRRVGGQVAAELVERGGLGLRLLRGGLGGDAAGEGEELTGADLAQRARALAAALGGEDDAHAARALAAVRADGEAVAREVRGGVHEVRHFQRSQLRRLRLAARSTMNVTGVTQGAISRRMR